MREIKFYPLNRILQIQLKSIDILLIERVNKLREIKIIDQFIDLFAFPLHIS